MKYMLLLYGEAGAGPAPGTPEFGEMLQEYGAATDAMREAGALLDSNPLQPVATATTLRVRDDIPANTRVPRWDRGFGIPRLSPRVHGG